jgi:hypothetical protein
MNIIIIYVLHSKIINLKHFKLLLISINMTLTKEFIREKEAREEEYFS